MSLPLSLTSMHLRLEFYVFAVFGKLLRQPPFLFIFAFIPSRCVKKPSCIWSFFLSSSLEYSVRTSDSSASACGHPWPLELPVKHICFQWNRTDHWSTVLEGKERFCHAPVKMTRSNGKWRWMLLTFLEQFVTIILSTDSNLPYNVMGSYPWDTEDVSSL